MFFLYVLQRLYGYWFPIYGRFWTLVWKNARWFYKTFLIFFCHRRTKISATLLSTKIMLAVLWEHLSNFVLYIQKLNQQFFLLLLYSHLHIHIFVHLCSIPYIICYKTLLFIYCLIAYSVNGLRYGCCARYFLWKYSFIYRVIQLKESKLVGWIPWIILNTVWDTGRSNKF